MVMPRMPETPCPGAEGSQSIPETGADQLLSLISQNRLSAVFQPILDFRSRSYFGFEGLIRGPQNTPLHTPAALFDSANRQGLRLELERACHATVLRAFARMNLPGRLFLNLSPAALSDSHFAPNHMQLLLRQLNLPPERIVIELTENQKIEDFSAIRDLLSAYRKTGYQIAIDDLGEGFANLRMWSEVRPEFIKIDRSLISGINQDKLKFMLVRSMQEIAEASGSRIIGEGMETPEELATVRSLGISYGQGYVIARPAPTPDTEPRDNLLEQLEDRRLFSSPGNSTGQPYQQTVRSLIRRIEAVPPETENEKIYRLFERQPELNVIPVVLEHQPIGTITRQSLLDQFARPYCRELYGRKSCIQFMNTAPLLIEHDTPVQEAGLIVSRASNRHLGEGFIITQEGRYLGLGSSQDLMAIITEMQISAARYANPLTQLPGNVPINQQIDRLLKNETAFTACYFDIDRFKPFNDAYGYAKGDEMIQILGHLLGEICDPRFDFIGHIGGDDFIVLFQSTNWQNRCTQALQLFDQRSALLCSDQDRALGGLLGEDRRGNSVFHALPSLSIGAVPVQPGQFCSHLEISAACANTKHQAKKTAGSCCFIERRHEPNKPGHDNPLERSPGFALPVLQPAAHRERAVAAV